MSEATVEQCLEAFLDRNYELCVRRAASLVSRQPTLKLAQAYLISLQRLGQAQVAAREGRRFLGGGDPDVWEHRLLQLTLGEVSPVEVLQMAETEEQRCQASYYHGARLLLLGEVEPALQAFRVCMASPPRCWEAICARSDAAALATTAQAPASGDQILRYNRLERRIHQLYQDGGWEEGLALAAEARTLVQRYFSEDHPLQATSLVNLAALYQALGNDAEAEPMLRQALALESTLYDEYDPQLAGGLQNLAVVCRRLGRYDEAERLYRKAVELYRRDPAQEDSLLICQANLAMLLRDRGNYAAAEALFRECLDLHLARGTEVNPVAYAHVLSNLADLYEEMDDWSQAEALVSQAVALLRRTVGEQHPALGTSLSVLAMLHRKVGNMSEALSLLNQALRIEQLLGENHPGYATKLNDLAICVAEQGDLDTAEIYLKSSLQIRRTVLGEQHPEVAQSLNNLGVVAASKNDVAWAERLHRQALDIRRRSFGDDHPSVGESLKNLALLLARMGQPEEALKMLEQDFAGSNRMISQMFSIGSERQVSEYLFWSQGDLHAYMSLVKQHFASSPTTVRNALDLVLRRKAIQAESVAARRDAVLSGRYPHLGEPLQRLAELRRQIAQKSLAGPGSEGVEADRRLLQVLSRQRDDLEAQLARQVPEMRLEALFRSADRRAVALKLPKETALVEFVRIFEFDFPNERIRGESYLAFVLLAGDADKVTMIDLGHAEAVDRMLAAFRSSVVGSNDRRLGSASLWKDGALPASDGSRLREAIFDPLVAWLAGRRRLFLAPDGDLARLPFEVLPTGDGRRLIDEYQISYLSVGRDVLRFGAATTAESAPPLVAADPDFDLGVDGAHGHIRTAGSPGKRSRDLDRASLHFDRLPGTRVEGERIAAMLHVRPILDGAVREVRVKTYRSPAILHVASHGFFLADQKLDRQDRMFGLTSVGGGTSGQFDRLSTPRLEDPLLRSGLALTGANTWLRGGALPEDAEDGVLTAEDVTGLDLLGTELVVLSACDTGLGDIRVGEGVFGLRRAFMLAGARTLIMSLWKVPDDQTQELMVDFYRRLLDGAPRAEALRQAQRSLRAKYSEPYAWGAFICQGDPGPVLQADTRAGT